MGTCEDSEIGDSLHKMEGLHVLFFVSFTSRCRFLDTLGNPGSRANACAGHG